jgi:hypothetical protein
MAKNLLWLCLWFQTPRIVARSSAASKDFSHSSQSTIEKNGKTRPWVSGGFCVAAACIQYSTVGADSQGKTPPILVQNTNLIKLPTYVYYPKDIVFQEYSILEICK